MTASIKANVDGSAAIQVGGSDAINISTDLNVGIGATPSAWNSSAKIIDVSTTSSFGDYQSNTWVVNNLFLNSSGAWIYKTTDFGSLAGQADGQHIFYRTASGTAGATATLQESMRIDTSGNVGIGTSSPSSRLDVRTSAAEIGRFSSSATNGGYQIFYPDNVTTPVYVGSLKAILATGNATDFAIIGTGANNLVLGTNSAERARFTSGGDFYIGQTTVTSPPTTGADVLAGGLIINPTRRTTASAANCNWDATTGNFARSTSSLRYKKDVEDANFGLADVLRLRAVTYKGKAEADGDKVFAGFIAEEIDEIGLDVFVEYDSENNPDSLAYPNMVALLAKAIQELKAELDATKAEVAALKGA